MKMKLQLCPACGYELSAASRVTEAGVKGPVDLSPKEGAITVCIGCGEVLIFGAGLRLERFDVNLLHPDDRIMVVKIRNAVLSMNSKVERNELPS